jgi:hypothetical protein
MPAMELVCHIPLAGCQQAMPPRRRSDLTPAASDAIKQTTAIEHATKHRQARSRCACPTWAMEAEDTR